MDREGKKYEIKTRKATAWNKPTNFPAKLEQLRNADFLICVEFDDNWKLNKLLKIPVKEVKLNIHNGLNLTKEIVSKYNLL